MLAALVCAAALALLALHVTGLPAPHSPAHLPWWALAIAFACSEIFVIHLPTARSAPSHTLREVPAVLALALATPDAYVTACLLGSGVVLVWRERQRGSKLAFNL